MKMHSPASPFLSARFSVPPADTREKSNPKTTPNKLPPIDLTTIGGDTPVPEDRTHPIFDYPEPSDSGPADMSKEQMMARILSCEARLEALETKG